MVKISTATRYMSPVHPGVYPHLTLILLGFGLFFTAWFFVYEVTTSRKNKGLFKELTIAMVGALFMGFGLLFLLLWVGIFV